MGVLAKLSTQASVPAPKIGSMPRFHNPADVQSAAIPGPGHYSTPSAVVESRQPRLPSVGFARAQRDANKKVSSAVICKHPKSHAFFRVLVLKVDH